MNNFLSNLFELNFIFDLRHARIEKATLGLMDEGYFMFPNEDVRKDIQKARSENTEAENDLRKHFLKI